MAIAEEETRPATTFVRDLLRRSAWLEKPDGVELRETHISWVFLTDRFVYKVKKPIAFGFLDFSTPEKRRQACLDEIRLNRRLAPDTYLGVIPITRSSGGHFRVGGVGKPVDWAVKMHRLDDDRSLDYLIRTHTLHETELQRLVNRLICFYSSLPPLSLPTEQYRSDISRHVAENLYELRDPHYSLPADIVDRVHAAQRRFLELAAELLDGRVCDGRIVEGHGDLRPEHIYLVGEPVVIDCIEFSRELRRIDVLDEISFLAMECAALGAPSIGRRILTQFGTISGDRPDARLLAFYQSYRACVRAKVLALRSRQLAEGSRGETLRKALRYLAIAEEFARQLGPPLLVVVSGAAGTGKSTIAAGLAERLHLVHLQTDLVRREMFGDPGDSQDRYLPERRAAVYQEMLHRAGQLLATHDSAVLDGTFLQNSQLENASDIARRHGATLVVVRCQCPCEIAKERIDARLAAGESASEATPAIYDQQAASREPIPEGMFPCVIDTTLSWPQIWDELRRHFRRETFTLRETTPRERLSAPFAST